MRVTSEGPTKRPGQVQRVVMTALASVVLAASASDPAGAQQDSASVRARVSGVVFDSLASRPLAGAVVQLVALQAIRQARSTVTGASGLFAFDSVEVGSYLLGFFHPLLDSLGVQSPLSRIDVHASGMVRVPIAVPSAATLRTMLCGPRAVPDSVGLYVGYIRAATDGFPLSKAGVRVQWSEISISADGVRRVTPSVQGEASEQGGLALCGLPIGGTVMVRAWSGSDSSGFAELEVPSSGLLRRDLFVGAARSVAVQDSTADSLGVAATVVRGNAALRGVVTRPDGAPLEGARLSVWGSGVEATTSSTGSYRLLELPAGTYTLEARALGFLPQRLAVDVMETGETVVDVRLESFGTYLDTVKVTGRRVYESRERREFEERRRRGFGTFMDEEYIERRQPMYVADLMRMAPGVMVVPGTFGQRIMMRGMGFSAFCVPAVFIDGVRVFANDGDIDAFVNVNDIRAMEVYTRGSSVPAQFQTLEGCGSLVIWTGGRQPLVERPKRK